MADHLNPPATSPVTLKTPTTVPVAFVHGMLAGVRARGEPIDGFLSEAGIPADLLEHAGTRVTGAQYVALFRLLIELRRDECLGFLSRPLKPGSFALMAHSALGARNLGSAIRRVSRTFSLLQDDVVLALHSEGDLAGVGLHFEGITDDQPAFLHEMLARVVWRLLAWLAGGRLPPERFDFAFGPPPYAGSYGDIFPARLEFGRAQTAFWFDAKWLQAPVRRDDAALRVFLADAQANIIMPRNASVVSARVRGYLQRTQPAWPDLAVTAGALHMSTATLQRRLAMEGTSFQTVKDELRRDTAIIRLNTCAVPLAELAQELGFTDSAAFQRAFKGWTGSAPGAYRKSRLGPEDRTEP
ncbi:AraC family transcriptional regulator [Cupriavidus numazuensis]|uniref:HTH-type transcriptional regulator n=1 Tax=Cupriavidus numazuensis TaxID=221992 RepID=A0ABN7Q782_9BURK|nr:AraC family transcriptional regulator [Cupriavidus numazuensis]CAG2155865.1 putative HTH-type transcriptional regulator [Cupriavidus numazuensis]